MGSGKWVVPSIDQGVAANKPEPEGEQTPKTDAV